jgi:hypothetical protein
LCNSNAVVLSVLVACGADGGDDALAGGGASDDGVGVKRLGCRYCEYRADYPSDIARHERTHTGEKPYGCRYCEYRATQASTIRAHPQRREAFRLSVLRVSSCCGVAHH